MLLGKAPLGQGAGGKPRFVKPYYLLNDTFTTNRAAGAVNGTRAEPGPGLRTVTDSESKLSLTGGAVALTPKTVQTNGDPGLWYGPQTRTPGRLLVAQATPSVNNQAFDIGWDNDQSGTVFGPALLFRSTGVLTERWFGTAAAALMNYSGGTTYTFAIALRSIGHFIWVKVGSNWILLWHLASSNSTPLYPTIANVNTTATCNYIRIPATLWLPTPLASDGFSAWGTTDGLGHAEGVAGGLGSGGSGLAWTNQIGTFGATGGAAQASALSGGIAAATVDSGKTDVLVTAKTTRSTGVAGVLVAYVDANNHIRAVHNGTNAQLIKRVAGVDTNVVSVAATYAAAAEIRVIREGTAYRLYYGGALIGSQQTISDAVFNSVTKQGIYTTDTGNVLDDFIAYARGTGGEYAALDNY